ncbi:MAG: hypothetical protein FJ276_28380, partial [Planctomycetes bacterium]|nr:hypothetical protein [Planctomycetota bacterium]
NRNFLHEGMGFFFCLDLVGRVAPEALLINQHVGPAFRFSGRQRDAMLDTLRERTRLLQELLPWDDPNFGIDEGWARFYPYATEVRPGESVRLSLRLQNHSPKEQTFAVKPRLPAGWTLTAVDPALIGIPPREERAVELAFAVPANAPAGIRLVTADISWDDWDLREWTEAMVTVVSD